MFKRILFALSILSFLACANATIVILKPVYSVVEPGQTIQVGSVMRGERLLLVIDRNAYFHTWTDAFVDKGLLGKDWTVLPARVESTSISIEVVVPSNAEFRSQTISLTLSDKQTGIEETAAIAVLVEKGLVSVQLPVQMKTARVGETVCYPIILQNWSVSSHKVFVSSSLPSYWFSGIEKEIKPKDFAEVEACIEAKVIGSRDFDFFVDSLESSERLQSRKASIEVLPTIQGKYAAALNGLPFYMPTLLPYFLLDSIFSFLR
ncbi:MAG: hypothetical protein QXK06_02415 [Candidatus Diapherotrites archaeon]